jgi:hypothetical protein
MRAGWLSRVPIKRLHSVGPSLSRHYAESGSQLEACGESEREQCGEGGEGGEEQGMLGATAAVLEHELSALMHSLRAAALQLKQVSCSVRPATRSPLALAPYRNTNVVRGGCRARRWRRTHRRRRWQPTCSRRSCSRWDVSITQRARSVTQRALLASSPSELS